MSRTFRVDGIQCTTTGLHLVPAVPSHAYRIQKRPYSPTSAPRRTAGEDPGTWNRFDTEGSTLYLGQSAECALAETLAPLRRAIGSVDPLQDTADFLGMSLEEFYEEVADQWQERNFMGTGSVPRIWRTDRALHTIALPEEGWWVDIEHPDSIGAIEKSLTDLLKTQKIAQLDTSHLRSPNRHLTTAIAQWTREQVLFDGSEALGVIFGSRHGEYLNWAG